MTSTRVRNYLNSGAELKMTNDRVVLSLGSRKQITLRGDNGTLTNAGKSWEILTGRALMAGGSKIKYHSEMGMWKQLNFVTASVQSLAAGFLH